MTVRKREYLTDPYRWDLQGGNQSVHRPRPVTEVEALMQLAPHQNADLVPLEKTAPLKELLGIVLDELSDEDKWIFERLFIERLSLRKTGAVIGIPKTSLARRRDKIRHKLIAELAQHELVRDWLNDRLRL